MKKRIMLIICVLLSVLLSGCADKGKTSEIDIDLTDLNANLAYSAVCNMLMEPKGYIGKSVKMEGLCGYYDDAYSKEEYYSCVVCDETGCCSQAIEFVLDHGDYPVMGDEICVVGKFSTYEDGGVTYCTLADAELVP